METVSEAPTSNQDTEIGFEIKMLERHLLENKVQAIDGSIVGLLKGGCVVSWKVDDRYRVIEIKSGSAAYACVVDGA